MCSYRLFYLPIKDHIEPSSLCHVTINTDNRIALHVMDMVIISISIRFRKFCSTELQMVLIELFTVLKLDINKFALTHFMRRPRRSLVVEVNIHLCTFNERIIYRIAFLPL